VRAFALSRAEPCGYRVAQRDFGHGFAPRRAARRDFGCRLAPRCPLIAWCSAIPGAGVHRATRLPGGAARFRAPARAALRGYCVARCDFECGLAPRYGRRAARRDFGRAFAPRYAATTQLNAIPGAGSRRAITAWRGTIPGAGQRRAARLLHSARDSYIFLYIRIFTLYSSIFQPIPAHSRTFRIFAIFAEHIGICRGSLNMQKLEYV